MPFLRWRSEKPSRGPCNDLNEAVTSGFQSGDADLLQLGDLGSATSTTSTINSPRNSGDNNNKKAIKKLHPESKVCAGGRQKNNKLHNNSRRTLLLDPYTGTSTRNNNNNSSNKKLLPGLRKPLRLRLLSSRKEKTTPISNTSQQDELSSTTPYLQEEVTSHNFVTLSNQGNQSLSAQLLDIDREGSSQSSSSQLLQSDLRYLSQSSQLIEVDNKEAKQPLPLLLSSSSRPEAINFQIRGDSTDTFVKTLGHESDHHIVLQNITNSRRFKQKNTDTIMPTSRNPPMSDEDAVAAADKEMEERANRAKALLSQRYKGLKSAVEEKQIRKMQLERRMVGLPEEKKQNLRRVLEHEEMIIQKENRKKITTSDFESLTVIGRGAFGEVRLVRRKGKREDPQTGEIFALKSMKKEMMVIKNQVGHVRAERDALAKASENNRWLTVLNYSFFDDSHLYMVMEYLPGGDLMSLLIKEDTFSESVTMFFMAEAAQAISSVHALGYIHRDIKPDNMLLDARGHLKLTDLGLCKKVGEVSPSDDPEVVLELLRGKGIVAQPGEDVRMGNYPAQPGGANAAASHRGPDDEMAMSIDGVEGGPKRDAKTRREMAYSTVGTPDYIAPEVLAAQNGASGYSYTCAVDWWSLGVIMFECLVGYTPFYADDPVTTCRKILRWRQCLDMPAETKAQLSPECIDFLSCLLAGPESRIGSSQNGVDFENGFKQVIQHPWFRNFDWEGLRDREGPLLPNGSKEFPDLLEYLKTCPKTDPRFKTLIQRVTQNFDTFEDFGTNLEKEGKVRVNRNTLDQFYDYSYRRVRKPRVPLPEMLND